LDQFKLAANENKDFFKNFKNIAYGNAIINGETASIIIKASKDGDLKHLIYN
jgi:hypothetical protein